jgi:hypothetical protein
VGAPSLCLIDYLNTVETEDCEILREKCDRRDFTYVRLAV